MHFSEVVKLRENKFLKWLLIIQSYVPLFLLLLIKYWDWQILRLAYRFFYLLSQGEIINAIIKIFLTPNCIQCFLIISCCIMLVWGIWIYYYFKGTELKGFRDRGEKIIVKCYTTETSISFFVTYIVPLVLDDITELKGFLCFLIIFLMMVLLMRNTNLFYQNPILVMLGYNTFQFQIVQTSDSNLKNKDYIAITRGEFDEEKIIKWKKISDNIFLVYNKN